MPKLKSLFKPANYFRYIRALLRPYEIRIEPNWQSCVLFHPGHYYSPLLDIASLQPNDTRFAHDGLEWWEHIDLRKNQQQSYFIDLLSQFQPFPFLTDEKPGARYHSRGGYFPFSDAFTLSGVIRKEKPKKIIEVGSGFSSAAMLDTLDEARISAQMTFIEPYPERLYSLLSPSDRNTTRIFDQPVQEISLNVFDELEAQDLLFIDSSHVAKIGSDLSFLFLRVLPRLKPGVIIHIHDIFYPFSYPIDWIREGRAWNESLFLRAFLIGNPAFEIVAFNSYAAYSFPEIFRKKLPAFLNNPGGSIWLRKTK